MFFIWIIGFLGGRKRIGVKMIGIRGKGKDGVGFG